MVKTLVKTTSRIVTAVHSPHDGGWYLEDSRLRQGRWQQRHSKQVWPTAEEAERAMLNKRVRFETFS